MKKIAMFLISIVILISGTACTHNGKPSNQGNNQNGGITSNHKRPGPNHQADSAYNLDDLIAAVKKVGCISGAAEKLDAKSMGAEKGLAYGNVVFLQYDGSKAYFDAYDANQVTINGKTVKIAAINGPYIMVFLDGNVDQKAVKAFLSIGFGN